MMQDKDSNPFQPGFGKQPPYLAGRENQKTELKKVLADLEGGRSPAATMVMYGPRGMGKTAMLGWLKDESKSVRVKGKQIRVISAIPTDLSSPTDLWNCLLPQNRWKKKFIPKRFTAGVGFDAGLNASVTWESHGPVKQVLQQTLIKACKKRPMMILIDEAHRMDAGLCDALLNIDQTVRGNSPFLLILAGTPDLRDILSTVNASFAERSNKIGLGRLDAQSTADAIVKPLEEHGLQITDAALDRVVESSQQFPYFIQQWGGFLWDAANNANLTCLTDKHVDAVEPFVNGKKTELYRDRLHELSKDKHVLLAAQAIVKNFRGESKYQEAALLSAIKETLPDASATNLYLIGILEKLTRLNLIWCPPGGDQYEPGIPSLMTYVLDKKQENFRTDASKTPESNQGISVKSRNNDSDMGR